MVDRRVLPHFPGFLAFPFGMDPGIGLIALFAFTLCLGFLVAHLDPLFMEFAGPDARL